MGGPNLEVFKFGMYVMFPIGFMYYFGTNLDSRFAVPDFWPKKGQTHAIPFERDEIDAELERLKHRRLAARARRLEMEGLHPQQQGDAVAAGSGELVRREDARVEALQGMGGEELGRSQGTRKSGWRAWFS